jgi:ankyrin repeat protein
MLHTAAMHNRADCIPLLVSKGVIATAVDAEGRSALQLACLYSDAATVQALVDSGGWLDSLATACLLKVVTAGKHEVLSVLIECAADSISTLKYSRNYTLLHAAAA